jgi:TatD DNase family protein
MFLVDSHCHLDLLDLTATQGQVLPFIQRAQQAGVHYFLNVCVSIAEFKQNLITAKKFPFVATSVGLHPNETTEETSCEELVRLGRDAKVLAIGETGLDYYRTTGDHAPQQQRFREHIQAAKQLQKPLIIHTREAIDDTLKILKEENAAEVTGVMHCFTENWASAKKALDLGFYISISGVVTFKNAETVREVAQKTPISRLLIETDAPYLAPQPMRGQPNEPAYVKHTAAFIAQLRDMTPEAFAHQTTDNFFTLFKGAERPHV